MRTALPAFLVLLVLISACGPAPGISAPAEPAPPAGVDPGANPACQGDECAEDPPGAENPTPPPLRFVLPTPGEEPVSAWRPPLYPVPWALSPFDHFYFARPIAADEVNWPKTDYRYGGVFFRPDVVHSGVDIPAPPGTPVLAAGPGTVVWAGWGLFSGAPGNLSDPYGMAVAIRHDFGYQGQVLYTVYAHLEQVDVAAGQWLDTGDPLGLVGDTGFTTGPHLHFEVRLGENSFYATHNPELWLAPPQGWGVLAARVMDTYRVPLIHYDVIVRSEEQERTWIVKTYGGEAARSDPYYNENLVLSDLPAGRYIVLIWYAGLRMELEVEIFPGRITYFSFQGFQRFNTDLPPTPGPERLTPGP
jgi:murein DD-endopeptidase MepM/ murein hydrolase activator NlpD